MFPTFLYEGGGFGGASKLTFVASLKQASDFVVFGSRAKLGLVETSDVSGKFSLFG